MFRNMFLNIRNSFVKFFKINIILFEKNNEIINNKYLIYCSSFLYRFIYKYLLYKLKINYLFKMDDIYFYEDYNINEIHIKPIILEATIKILNSENKIEKIDITNIINKYNLNVPINIFLYNENIKNYISINFKLLKLKDNIKEVYINSNNFYNKLYQFI